MQKYTSNSRLLIPLKGAEILEHLKQVFQTKTFEETICCCHHCMMRSYFNVFISVLKQHEHTFKTHFQFFTLVNIVSLCLRNRTGRAWERTSCEQMRHLKCQFRAHSNANWWCFMVQPVNSCCFNLAFQTNAFIYDQEKAENIPLSFLIVWGLSFPMCRTQDNFSHNQSV